MLDAARAADGIILGPVSHSDYPSRDKGGINGSAHLRVQLDLYANIRPCRSREGSEAMAGRRSTSSSCARIRKASTPTAPCIMGTGEYMPTPDVAIAMRKVTAKGSRRIAKAAFELARTRPRRKLTYVHKVNVLKISDALFLKECRAVAEDIRTSRPTISSSTR